MRGIEKLAALARHYGCQVRIKLRADELPEQWANGIGLSVKGYIELNGPWPFRDVEWLEINPSVSKRTGRLMKPKQHNHTENLISVLQTEQMSYAIVEGIVRLHFDVIAF